MENHIKMDDLGVPPFMETPIDGVQYGVSLEPEPCCPILLVFLRFFGHGLATNLPPMLRQKCLFWVDMNG